MIVRMICWFYRCKKCGKETANQGRICTDCLNKFFRRLK